ncbi:c-type cytochrome [Sapientia aquatica]
MKSHQNHASQLSSTLKVTAQLAVALTITSVNQYAIATGDAMAGDPAAGKALFNSLGCASCHAIGPGARAGFGPQLNGVIGRVAGSTVDYQSRYSAAMKKSGIVWSEQTLTKFINSPNDLVPGTNMRFWGLSNETKLANLLAYLKTFPANPK